VLTLIDHNGCPQNMKIFPELKKVHTKQTRYLYSRFHAFKFPDSSSVNFDVVIHFCPRYCPPVTCDANIQSFGKRKRRNVFHSHKSKRIVADDYSYFGNAYPTNDYTTPRSAPVTTCFEVLYTRPTLPPTTTTPTPLPMGPIIFPGPVMRFKRTAVVSTDHKNLFEYKVAHDVPEKQNTVRLKKNLEEHAQIEQTTRSNFTENQRVLIADNSEIPLQIQLKVFTSKNASDSDRILYGDNNAILVAGLGRAVKN
jgi:hypothetical protein